LFEKVTVLFCTGFW